MAPRPAAHHPALATPAASWGRGRCRVCWGIVGSIGERSHGRGPRPAKSRPGRGRSSGSR
eukprot:4370518-Alexandrium_andersonii.AAC.1